MPNTALLPPKVGSKAKLACKAMYIQADILTTELSGGAFSVRSNDGLGAFYLLSRALSRTSCKFIISATSNCGGNIPSTGRNLISGGK